MNNKTFSRRKFNSQMLGGIIGVSVSSNLIYQNNSSSKDKINWYNAKQIGVEGKGWTNTERYFDRLPSKAEDFVRKPVWELSRYSSGMCLRFKTDSRDI